MLVIITVLEDMPQLQDNFHLSAAYVNLELLSMKLMNLIHLKYALVVIHRGDLEILLVWMSCNLILSADVTPSIVDGFGIVTLTLLGILEILGGLNIITFLVHFYSELYFLMMYDFLFYFYFRITTETITLGLAWKSS